MRAVLAALFVLVFAGCREKDKFNYTVAAENRPYINRFFDRNRLARVECGRFTGWRERFYVGGTELTRREYFEHLQQNVGWRLAGICMQEKAKRDCHYDEYVHAEEAVRLALVFWETEKNRVDSPELNEERYREGLR